jgi:glutathione peroxidase
MGECEANAPYMLSNCADSCAKQAEMALRDAEDIKVRRLCIRSYFIESITYFIRQHLDLFSIRHFIFQNFPQDIASFFDLEAKDIDGELINFGEFKGKVTVVVNVASHCGYTESHYAGLVALYNEIKDTGVIEILAFPCNQFGKQEPEECPTIKRFAEKKGVEFRMMDKIDVNGPTASKVYKYLKRESGIATITWNFAAYFVVGPEGNIQGFTGVEPHELKETIGSLIDREL